VGEIRGIVVIVVAVAAAWAAAPVTVGRSFSSAAAPSDVGRSFSSATSRSATQTPPAGAGYFLRRLDDPRERREARPDLLDSPVLPGSVMKAVTLVAAMEAGIVTADTGAMCRRVVTVDGIRFTCAHPVLGRPLNAVEALAHSCNDFFVSLAGRLRRDEVNRTRLAAGLPLLPASAKLGPALVGLDGPRVTPRSLVDVLARLTGAGADSPVPMRADTKRVLLQGLRGAAEYGTASAFGDRRHAAWAKTGTSPMPGGGQLGLLVALVPPDRPTHGLVVVAPGAAGADAATIGADLIESIPDLVHRDSASVSTGPLARLRSPAVERATAGQAPLAPPARSAPLAAPAILLGRTLANGRTRIERVPLDDYIAQVVAGEGQPKAGDAALQALATAARTFALANRNRHRREGFDLCDTTHCQVVRPASDASRRAATASTGRVLLHDGQPAFVFYSASCGGRIEQASQVWPGAVDYGTSGLVDEACADEPAWQSEVRAGDIERALRAAGLRGSRLRNLRVLQRNASGRVVRLRAEGFSPPDIGGNDFRTAVGRLAGWQLVKSTAFDVVRTGGGYRFRGRGFGHGVGLCVIGAGTRASRGASADEILRFYYPSLTLGRMDEAAVAVASGAPVPSGASRTNPDSSVASGSSRTNPDIQLALPAALEGERSTLLALIRRARDEVAKATGTATPAALRVTVHPNVESFGRETGQPWWASGATDGASIDLLPLPALQQSGQLERTVRHEVAHALLDPRLAGRPMWVREGAAIYFAQAGPRPAPPGGRVRCPSDAELLRAPSAGAQRDAYARAEACFAREIAAGKRWDQIP
jgi:SpoIID/LytB domain protein